MELYPGFAKENTKVFIILRIFLCGLDFMAQQVIYICSLSNLTEYWIGASSGRKHSSF